MAEAGIDAVVAASPANVRYLTGYWCWLAPLFREFMVQPGGSGRLVQENFALLPREGDPCLVIEPYWGLNAVDGWVRDVRFAGAAELAPADGPALVPPDLQPLLDELSGGDWPADPVEALAAALAERGLAGGQIGVELEAMPAPQRERLRAALPAATLLDCTNLLRLVRAVKTGPEVELLARAARVAEDAATEVVGNMPPQGATLDELADRFRSLVAAGGADLDHFSLSLDGLGFATGGGRPLPAAGLALPRLRLHPPRLVLRFGNDPLDRRPHSDSARGARRRPGRGGGRRGGDPPRRPRVYSPERDAAGARRTGHHEVLPPRPRARARGARLPDPRPGRGRRHPRRLRRARRRPGARAGHGAQPRSARAHARRALGPLRADLRRHRRRVPPARRAGSRGAARRGRATVEAA